MAVCLVGAGVPAAVAAPKTVLILSEGPGLPDGLVLREKLLTTLRHDSTEPLKLNHGIDLAQRAKQILSDGRAAGLAPTMTLATPAFDWRELKRFAIDEAWLRTGATIETREPGRWDTYRWTVLVAGAVLIGQFLLIGSLLIQRDRRRLAERDLRDRQEALRESQSRYTLATAAGAVGVWDRNIDTNDLFADATLKTILGFEDAEIPNRLEDWKARVHPEDPELMTLAAAAIPGDTDAYETVHRMSHKDGSLRWFLSHGTVVRRADGTPCRMIGTSLDVTERKRAADLFRLALEAATTGMLMVSRTGAIALVNAHVERLFGYRREELIGESVHILFPARLRGAQLEDQWNGTAIPIPGGRELAGLRRDGSEIPLEIGFSPLRTPEGEFVLCAIADITERKQAEREREDLTRHLRDLTGRLIAAQEVERARIARDLHDDVSQQIAALSIGLSGLKRGAASATNPTDLRDEISALQQRAIALAKSVRELSHDLHPDVLRHAGLAAALTAHCNALQASQSLAVSCTAQGDVETIDADAALCLYRIAQEALQNVVKHAHARHAEVKLLRTGDSAEITIADDGKGFDVRTRKSGRGLGLISITERARLAGGTVSIVTALNQGTQVRVRLPIETPAAIDAATLSSRFAASV